MGKVKGKDFSEIYLRREKSDFYVGATLAVARFGETFLI